MKKQNINIQYLSDKLVKDGKRIVDKIINQSEILGKKGRVKFEVEKLRWELKLKYNELGKYVSKRKISNSVTDFSHDRKFLSIVDEINRILLYIDEQQK